MSWATLISEQQSTPRTYVSRVAAHKVTLRDLVWLEHVAVVGERGEEERENFAFSVRRQHLAVGLVARSLPHVHNPPRIVGAFEILIAIETVE